ncbi:MAG: hypothetical protein K6F70_04200 [Eggerthellaceae bacterium]|nr:hypothetical protein [Eggerthellaceae bacterium]
MKQHIIGIRSTTGTRLGYALAAGAICSLTIAPLTQAFGDNEAANPNTSNATNDNAQEQMQETIASTKKEIVYTYADANGNTTRTQVNDTLTNPSGASLLDDASTLTDIEGNDNDQTYSQNGTNLVWSADGDEVSYKGSPTESTPITMKVSYTLDGNAISAEQLAGKSGRVTIRFDYENTSWNMCDVNGTQEKVYTPFACISTLLLSNDHFTNIETENGKIIDDGSNSVAVGFALPGLQESLGVSEDDYEIPSYFEITADVTDFQLDGSYTIATTELFSDINTDSLNMNDIDSAQSGLQQGMDALLSGTDALAAGLLQLASGAQALDSGAQSLHAGASALQEGAAALPSGTQQLAEGASNLAEGASALEGATDQLNNGTQTLASGTASLADGIQALQGNDNAGLQQTSIAAAALQSGLGKLASGTQALIDELDANTSRLYGAGNAASAAASSAGDAKSNAQSALTTLQALKDSGTLSQDEERQVDDAISALTSTKASANSAQVAAESAQDNIDSAMQSISSTGDLGAGLRSTQSDLSSAASDASDLATNVSSAYDTAGTLADSASKVSSGSSELAESASAMTTGVSRLSNGATSVSSASAQLAASAGPLYQALCQLSGGTETLASSTPLLANGLQSAYEGSVALSSGLSAFQSEGIQKIVDALGDANTTKARLDAVSEQASAYDNFSGKAAGSQGTVRFVFKTAAIEAGN